MKKLKFSICFLVLLISSLSAFGQFGIGAQAVGTVWQSKINSKDVNPTFGLGFGVQAFYNIRPKLRVRLGADYIIGIQKKFEVDVTFNQNREPAYSSTVKTNNLAVCPDLQYAFYGSFDDAGVALYAFAGLDMNNYSYNISGAGYGGTVTGSGITQWNAYPFSSSGNYTGFTPHIGLGAEYGITESSRLFLELKYAYAGAVSNKVSASDPLLPDKYNPPYLGIDLGLRFGLHSKK
jgi:hypothetical protein